MDSDMDTTSEEPSSTESSTDSSDDDEKLELTQICGVRLQLPQGLCERKAIFDEFFSAHTWNSLSETHKQHLKTLLPTFPKNDDQEKNITLCRLFNKEVFRFNSPLEDFHEHLQSGHYKPDIAKMRQLIKRAELSELKYRHSLYRERLKKEVIESRNKLLNLARNLPPGVELKMDRLSPSTPSYVNPIGFRTKRRYFRELAAIKEQFEEQGFSSDENYPEGPPMPLSRKLKRHLNAIKSPAVNSDMVMSTIGLKSNSLDLERQIVPNYNPFYISEEMYKNLLVTHKRRRIKDPSNVELDTSGITLPNIINRTDLTSFKKLNMSIKPLDLKPHKKKIKKEPRTSHSPDLVNKIQPFYGHSSQSEMDSDSEFDSKNKIVSVIKPLEVEIKTEPVDISTYSSLNINSVDNKPCSDTKPFAKVTPATLSDLDGIDMMNIPIDLEDSNINILEFDAKPELMQDTHVNFLCLIRDIICSTPDHRMAMSVLEGQLQTWQENPISPLNDWYNLANSWIALLPLAIDFLSGNCSEQPEDFVPYIEYKTKIDMYQWIGAGRDSDSLLIPLCQFWLDHRGDMKPSIILKDSDVEVSDRLHTPPPPRCPTTWSIRKANTEETKSYQEQERRRYHNPHKSFTFKCNGYESVVGPIKGLYNHQNAASAKARGHSVLTTERPNFVTILTLVRDATARLPNGEGTRADICELLKSSQYINPKVPDSSLQSVVSGALDRMHTQFDPCVRYDSKRKVWIYLHRNRTEGDFERVHQQYQGIVRIAKKPIKSKTKEKSSQKPESVQQNSEPLVTPKLVQQNSEPLLTPKLEPIDEPLEQNDSLVTLQEPISLPVSIGNVSNEVQVSTSTLIKYPKTSKNVKIVATNQGKSLILPNSLQKQLEHKTQLLDVGQQKIVLQQKPNPTEQKVQTKISLPVQQQILQSSQLQNVKGITILKSTNPTSVITSFSQASTTRTNDTVVTNSVVQNVVSHEQVVHSVTVPNKVAQRLTVAQQQQILQTLKQKVLPVNQTVINAQYRAVAKSRGNSPHVQKQIQAVSTATLLEQTKISSADVAGNKSVITAQTPLVAKILTNAAGQVISVESLLAHQKQHGSLPQGTTLRISGTKSGQTNLIQLSGPTTQSTVTQLAGTSNIASLTNQTKIISTADISTTALPTQTSKSVIKSTPKGTAKVIPRITQQLVSTKFIAQNIAGHKVVQPKVLVAAQNQIKIPVSNKNIATSKALGINVNANAGTVRMVNAPNLNLAQLAGKPVFISSKGNAFQTIQGQNIILQTEGNPNNQGLIITNNAKTITNHQSSNAVNISDQHAQVILGSNLKVQQTPRVVLSSAIKSSGQSSSGNQIVLGGQGLRVHTAGASNRVLLAGQNQGQIITQQILLPVGFQGAPFNIKTLQGLKVVPLAATQGKGMQGRQVYARIMNPANIVRVTQASETIDVGNLSQSTAE